MKINLIEKMNKREKGNKRTEQEIPMYPGSEVSLGKKMNPLKGQMRTAGGKIKKIKFQRPTPNRKGGKQRVCNWKEYRIGSASWILIQAHTNYMTTGKSINLPENPSV